MAQTTPEPSHSPLPWHQMHRRCGDEMYRTQVRDDSGQEIATLAWAPRPEVDGVIGTYREANARFIVEACNQHAALIAQRDALREALKELLDAMFESDGGYGTVSSGVRRAGDGELIDRCLSLAEVK